MKSEIENITQQYGWAVQEDDKAFRLFNRNGVEVCRVTIKGSRYTIHDTGEVKLLTGNNSLPLAIERLLTKFYFAQKIAR